jgi:hypothetical protein
MLFVLTATQLQWRHLEECPWAALWPNLLALVGFAILLFSFSAWRFRNQ